LVLIEEIENGLHPLATVRMVDYLIDFARRKKSQVIFTTHSNDALEPLPPEAIWVAIDNNILQGKPDIRALKAIQGYAESPGIIFVEDDFAHAWVSGILRYSTDAILRALDVYAMKGDSLAVEANKHHNRDPSITARSICLLDGDSQQSDDPDSGVLRLPGACPERYVFDSVMEKVPDNVELFCLALQQNAEGAEQIIEECRRVARTNTDHHILFAQVGEEIGGLSQESTQDAFIGLWCKFYPDETAAMLQQIRTALSALPISNSQSHGTVGLPL
ncbi:ATP-binding protein, partial [bacterium]|nr:ATP-binding protein [bacterium]